MATNLNVTELDFDQIKDNLKNFLKRQTEFNDYDFDDWIGSIGEDDKGDEDDEEMDEDDGWDDGDYDFLDPPK